MFVQIPYEQLIRAFLLVLFVLYLFRQGSYSELIRGGGGRAIIFGVVLVLIGTLMDMLSYSVVVRSSPSVRAQLKILEHIGYTLGVISFLFGLVRLLPAIIKLEATEKSLRDSEEKFRQIFETSPDPVVLARLSDGAVIDINPACVNITGLSREKALGRNSAELDLWADPAMRHTFREVLLRDGQISNMEVEFNLVGGVDWGLLSARVIVVGGEQCILIMVRDISVAKKAELALRDMGRMRNEFVSTAAHELLTPLSVLMGYAELLSSKQLAPEMQEKYREEALDVIVRKGEELSHIVDDLLDISRFEQGQTLRIDLAEFQPALLLARIVKNFQVYSPGNRFDLFLAEQDSRLLYADERRLTQVMENLLSNAVKYSPADSVIVVREERTPGFCKIHVEDSGVGMTPEQLSRVFDKFYRVDASNTAVSGLGLGMSIVKQVVEAHGGQITLKSEPGQGTKVTVELPWVPSHQIDLDTPTVTQGAESS